MSAKLWERAWRAGTLASDLESSRGEGPGTAKAGEAPASPERLTPAVLRTPYTLLLHVREKCLPRLSLG